MPIGRRNARVSQHYKAAIASIFREYPNSKYIILLEEDLDVSIDFFRWIMELSELEFISSVFLMSDRRKIKKQNLVYI